MKVARDRHQEEREDGEVESFLESCWAIKDEQFGESRARQEEE